MLTTLEDFKGCEGSQVWAIPTGNNARRNKSIVTFTVVKVKRKYITLLSSAGYEEDYTTRGATADQAKKGYGGNAGYIFFASESLLEEYQLLWQQKRQISSFFQNSLMRNLHKLSPQQIEAIYEIIKPHLEDD